MSRATFALSNLPSARRVKGGMASKLLSGGWSWRAPDGYLNKEIKLTELGTEEQLKHAKYKTDVTRFTSDKARDRKTLEVRRKKLEEKELNLWRAFTDHGMRTQIYESLTKECNEERLRVEETLRRLDEEQGDYIADLDAALAIISQIGDKFAKCTKVQ